MASRNTLSLQKIFDKIDDVRDTLHTELNKKISALEEKQKEYHEQNMTRLDEVMKELATLRDENTIGSYQVSELREGYTDHEKRLTILEKRV